MQSMIKNKWYAKPLIALALSSCGLLSCKKFVTIDLPQNSQIDKMVFGKEKTATAALLDAYSNMNGLSVNPNIVCASKASALSADEMTLTGTNATLQQLYTYSLDANQPELNSIWNDAYAGIYKVNAVIAGISAYGGAIDASIQKQLTGEARFLRAWFYTLLSDLYGDLPLALTPDYQQNRSLPRSPAATVYEQIKTDLRAAVELMQEPYLDGNNTAADIRVRANRDAAKALLARVSLYTGDLEVAERLATGLIEKTSAYGLEADLSAVFNTGSREAILQNDDIGWMMPLSVLVYELTGDPTSPLMYSFGMLSEATLTQFEPGDLRRDKWIRTYQSGATTYPYPAKYRNLGVLSQYQTTIRLAEMYLIRAEARILSGNVSDGIADLNIIRARARADVSTQVPDPLPALPLNLSPAQAMTALEKERITELFTEGHRWTDLRRWKGFYNPSLTRADEVMPDIAESHGATWRSEAKRFPLPQTELLRNTQLKQNEGY